MKNFYQIHQEIPYIKTGELHSYVHNVYPDVRIKMPGKHNIDTGGGDFIVEYKRDDKWYAPRHYDIFADIDMKSEAHQELVCSNILPAILEALDEKSPKQVDVYDMPGIKTDTLVRLIQTMSVCEYRRYEQSEPLGGRYLLTRFLIGIACGLWSAGDAGSFLKQGSVGLKKLRHKLQSNEPSLHEIRVGIW